MSGRSLLVFVVFVAAALPGGAAATVPETSPARASAYAGALNLPAMVLTPADLAAAGLPGYGTFGPGAFVPFDALAASTAEFRGLPEADVRATFADAGWRRFYGSTLGVASVPNTVDCRASQVAFSFVNEYADAAGATAAFAALGAHGDTAHARIDAVTGTRVPGDELRLEVANPAFGSNTGLSGLFRSDNLIGSVGIDVAADVGGDAASLASTVVAVETLAARLLVKMETTRAASDPGLPVLALRMDRATAPVVYEREGYRVRHGETLPVCGGVTGDNLAFPTRFAAVQDVYEVEQLLELGEEPADTNPYYLLRLIRFADEASAVVFLDAFPAATATWAGAATGAVPIAGVVDLGDEARAVGFGRGFNSDRPAAYEIAVRVGPMVVTVFLGSTLRPDLAIVEDLAEAQVACLAAAVCAPVPVPASLLADAAAFA